MGNFIDLLIFIGNLYKLAVGIIIAGAVGLAILVVIALLASLADLVF